MSSVKHGTIKIKKRFKFSSSKVYKAFSDVKARRQWSVPVGDGIKYLQSNFKVGGVDKFRCGDPKSLQFLGVVHYENLVKNKRIVSTETIAHKTKPLSTALITIELEDCGGFTILTFTGQITSYDGADMVPGYKQGWRAVLKNLEKFLAKKKVR